MIPVRATKRLVQLFERELRAFDPESANAPESSGKRRVSGELDQQVFEYVREVRSSGGTPEQMLVELKSALAQVARELPVSERSALVSTVTGRAIDAFFKPGPAPTARKKGV